MSVRSIFTSLIVIVSPLAVASANAQSLGDVGRRTGPGSVIVVTDSDGRTTRGVIQAISPSGVTLAGTPPVEFPTAQVARIDMLGDPMWDGAVKGGFVGVGMGLAACLLQPCTFARVAVSAGVYSLIGLVIDASIEGRTTVYRAPQGLSLAIAPVVDGQRKGVAIRLRF